MMVCMILIIFYIFNNNYCLGSLARIMSVPFALRATRFVTLLAAQSIASDRLVLVSDRLVVVSDRPVLVQ